MSDQSEALWLAEVLMSRASMTTAQRAQAAIELRRQHAEIERLREALTVAAKAELFDPDTGIIDADVLQIVQDVAKAALRREET